MRFYALLSAAGDSVLAEFPDCPGCVAIAGPREDIGRNASAVLRNWLEARLLAGGLPPLPSPRLPRRPRTRVRAIELPSLLALRIATRHARHLRGQTTAELAAAVGLPEQQILKLEHPAGSPSELTIARLSIELGVPRDPPEPKAAPPKSRQRELFPRSRRGARVRPVEVAAYEVAADDDSELDHDLTFSIRPSLWERLQTASDEDGVALADWLLQAAREKLALEYPELPERSDDTQQQFVFTSRGEPT